MKDGRLFSVFNSFSESVKLITHCPACKGRYEAGEAKIIEERPDYGLVFLQCRSCQKAILALVSANSFGVSSVGMVSDLTADDVSRFRSSQPVSLDDVLDIHQELEQPIPLSTLTH